MRQILKHKRQVQMNSNAKKMLIKKLHISNAHSTFAGNVVLGELLGGGGPDNSGILPVGV